MSAGVLVDLRALERIQKAVSRMAGAPLDELKQGLGAELESQTKRRIEFEKESPEGIAWPDWSDTHAATRHGGHSLLQGEGDLLESVQFDIQGDQILVGSPMIYAGTMQHGAAQGAFGRTSRNGPIPWGDIPAREYLGLSIENEEDLLELVEDFIQLEVMPK
jgi:phage virion morphogenesis protein